MHVDLIHLAGCASLNIVGDKGFHVRPPVIWLNEG